MSDLQFTDLGLSPALLQAIEQLGYEKPAPIQAEAIPLVLAGHSMIGQSQTGSGKTAAFAIPAVEMSDAEPMEVQVLIICPTRELATQVAGECYKLTAFKREIHSIPIYGGQSYDRQIRALRRGTQIVIGTPGRLIDHLKRGTLKLYHVKLVVLDEADEMLDMGFRDDIDLLLKATPPERQLVCFSATMARPIMELIQGHANDLKKVRIEHKQLTVPTTEQSAYEVRGRGKQEALSRLIDLHDFKLAVIFANTQRVVDELADELVARGYSADRIHGGMNQAQRERVMNQFRRGGLEFLVATDVAARGIDVDNIDAVFNYELPWDEEDYVHRIGRTGRAGRSGQAISLVGGREIYKLQSIERYTRVKIQRRRVPSLEEVEEKRTNDFFERIRTALQEGGWEGEGHLVDRLLEQGFASTDIASALIQELRKAIAPPASPGGGQESDGRDFDPRERGHDRSRGGEHFHPRGPRRFDRGSGGKAKFKPWKKNKRP